MCSHIIFSTGHLPHLVHRVDLLGMNQGCVVEEAVICRTPSSFVAEAGRCIDCRMRKEGLMFKAVGCHGELDLCIHRVPLWASH